MPWLSWMSTTSRTIQRGLREEETNGGPGSDFIKCVSPKVVAFPAYPKETYRALEHNHPISHAFAGRAINIIKFYQRFTKSSGHFLSTATAVTQSEHEDGMCIIMF